MVYKRGQRLIKTVDRSSDLLVTAYVGYIDDNRVSWRCSPQDTQKQYSAGTNSKHRASSFL